MRRGMVFRTTWGWAGVAESAAGIVSIVFPQATKSAAAAGLRDRSAEPWQDAVSPRLHAAQKQLREFMAGTRRSFSLPLDLSRGTEFQRKVWKALQAIPYGQLHSYRDLAVKVGGRRYARAVGGAVGANPLPIVVPCHRVVAQDRSLGGFSCGLSAKRQLLELEGSLSSVRHKG